MDQASRSAYLQLLARIGLAEDDPGGPVTIEGADPHGYDIVFDAGGAAETASLAILSAARGGAVNLFAGCPAGTGVTIDVTRVHYDEIRVLGSFHHTPAAFHQAFQLIATGAVEPRRFITGRAGLLDLPEALVHPGPGSLKTLVTF